MENLATKSTGDSLTAAEFNQIPDELENAITSAGVALSGADLFQLSKAIANYAASGNAYTDAGAANAYVLGVIGSKEGITSYAVGTEVSFIVGNSNTGASTVNINGVGLKSIKTRAGAELAAGLLKAGASATIMYDGTDFILENYISLGVDQTVQNVIASRALSVTYTNTTGRPIFVMANAIPVSSGSSGLHVTIDGVVFSAPAGIVSAANISQVWFVVPAGSTYRLLSNSGTTTLSQWLEIR